MPTNVGAQEFAMTSHQEEYWVVGSAPHADPFWRLFDESRRPRARLVIAFPDDASAKTAMGEWLDDLPGLKETVQRIVYDLRLGDSMAVGEVRIPTPELRSWLADVAGGETDELPAELAGVDLDVILLPPIDHGGRYVLVFDGAWNEPVRPRRLRWG